MAKLTKKQERDERILRNGFRLQRTFNVTNLGPLALTKAVHRIETAMHRVAEDYCNGIITEEQSDKKEQSAIKRLDALLNFKAQGIPVFINADTRGYALKISDAWMIGHPECDLERDWGGYGILAPEIN